MSRCCHCIQSGRRRCLTLRPATDCSHLCGRFFSRGTDGLQSLPHSSRVIELKMRLNSLPVSEFSSSNCTSESIARCFVLAHVSRQKTGVVCGSVLVNRITDCSVHPRFLIGECPSVSVACSVSVLTKLNATPVNSLTLDELAQKISQSTSSRAACSIASEWEDQLVTYLSTGGS